jgi:tetratricopeptide (TPR) repeat protein
LAFDSFDEIKVAFDIAQLKRQQGHFLEAYNQFLELLTNRLSSTQLMDADLTIMQSFSDLAGLLGEFEAADDLLRVVIEEYAAANTHHCTDYARLRRTQILLDSGQLAQASDLLQEMAPSIGDIQTIQFSSSGLLLWESGSLWFNTNAKERTILFTELYLAMGGLLAALGQYGDALIVFERGLFYATGEEIPSLAQQTVLPLKLAIASAHMESGNLIAANDDLSKINEYLDEHPSPEYIIQRRELSGKLHLLQGNFGKALDEFQQIQVTCQKLGIQQAELRSTLNLAHVLILLNQTSTAEQHLIDVHNDVLASGNTALASRMNLLLHLSRARHHSLAMDSPASVTEMLHPKSEGLSIDEERRETVERSPQSSNYLTWFENRALELRFYLNNLHLKAATDLLHQIQEVFQFTDSSLIKVQIQVLEGTLAYYQQKFQQARTILEKARTSLEEMGLKPELWQVQRILGWCLVRLNYPITVQETLAESTNALLTELTESLSLENQAIYLLNKWTADEEHLALEISLLQKLQKKLVEGRVWSRLWFRFRLIQKLSTLVQHIDRYKDVLAKRTLKKQLIPMYFQPTAFLWHRLLTHSKDRITLSFLILPDRVLVIRLGRFLLDFRVIAITRLTLRNQVQNWYKSIHGISGGRDISKMSEAEYDVATLSVKDACRSMTLSLASQLQIPILLKDLPKRIKALTIIPDDILHGFPFAVLPCQDGYLIEKYSLSIGYETIRQRSRNNMINRKTKALVVGISQGNSQIPSLPNVTEELQQIHRWLQSCQIDSLALENSSANKAAVLHSLPQMDLLHISCHGKFEPNRPDQSGLVLIPDPHLQAEILSLRELSEVDCSKLLHVTLASCWAADHFILPGRWVISLPETIWRSGAKSILGCLWEVHDLFAVSFMARFYEYLKTFPRDEALCNTQLDCLSGNLSHIDVDATNPIFWAGFVLYGDHRPLMTHRIPLRKLRPR